MTFLRDRTRLVTTAVLAIVGILFTLLTTSLVFGNITMRQHRISSAVIASTAMETTYSALIDEETGVRGYVESRNTTFLEPFYAGQAVYTVYWMTPHVVGETEIDSALAAFRQAADDVQPYFWDEVALVAHGPQSAALAKMAKARAAFTRVHASHSVAQARLEALITVERGQLYASYALARNVMFAMGVVLVLAGAGSSVFVERARHSAQLARRDPLTKLPNRRAFEEYLKEGLKTRRPDQRLAVLYADLDGFKPINDAFGHAAGDTLLVLCGERLFRSIRPGDFIARIGGDEFAAVLSNVASRSDAAFIAQRIVNDIEAPFIIGGATIGLGVSVGIALVPENGLTEAEIVAFADADMYRVKSSRREAAIGRA